MDTLAGSQSISELQQQLSGISEIITCLMRLSMAIRNPAPHDLFINSKHINISHFEEFDIHHARSKFPMAEDFLVVRLGKAISRRRQYLKYRAEHRKHLDDGVERLADQANQADQDPASIPDRSESTVASSIPHGMKSTSSSVDIDETKDFEDVVSETSYASSNADDSKLRPPPLPEAGLNGLPFECPLCFRIISARGVFAWT